MKEKERTKNEIVDSLEEKKIQLENAYEELVDKMRDEKDRMQHDLRHEYRNARRYVRANPEQGVGVAFIGGVVLGIVIASISR